MKILKLSVALFAIILMNSSCQKAVEQAADAAIKDKLISLLKSGYWTVLQYKENNKDSTTIFNNWKTYFEDNSVMKSHRINNSQQILETINGTWASEGAFFDRFTCSYNANEVKYPLTKLNFTWKIDLAGTNLENRVKMYKTNVSGNSIDSLLLLKN